METLDLHNTRHSDVEEVVSRFLNWAIPPCKIITGNSHEMKSIVELVVKRYNYFCYNESAYNHGCLIVVEFDIQNI